MQGARRAQELQWGRAASCHPLLTLLSDGQQGHEAIDKPYAHPSCVAAVAVSADSQHVLSADDQGRLKLWRLCVGPPVAKLNLVVAHLLHAGAITCLGLHEPSGLLATAGDDGCLRLWHLPRLLQCAAGQHAAAQLACLSAHGGSISACCFTSCGRFLASACTAGSVRLWSIAAREPLATLQLAASSVAFAPGDDAALLVAATGPGPGITPGPQLLDLRCVPAAREYCLQLVAAAADASSGGLGSSARAQAQQQQRQRGRQAALDPAVAVWLPAASPQAGRGAAAGSSSCTRRQVGSLATFGRRRRQRQEEAAAAEEQEEAGQAPAPAASGPSGGSPLSPASPHSPQWDDGSVPEAAVVARYEAAASGSSGSGGSEWDASTRSFFYRQTGHHAPVHWAVLLPAGLHVLTAATDSEIKLWSAAGGNVCCTLLPALQDQGAECCLCCRPAMSPCGRFVVCGGPSGAVAAWDLDQLQRTAHLPLHTDRSNAAAAAKAHSSPVTAVAVAATGGGCMLVSGDAAGRLHVRWQ